MKLSYDLYTPPEVVGGGRIPKDMSPIVLLHSIAETKNSWRTVAPVLARNTQRRVYALDFRNHGDSPRTQDYNVDLLVSDLQEFLLDRRLDRIVLVGHSLGGMVAIAFTLKEPQKVEKLVVEEALVSRVKHDEHSFVSQAFTFYTRVSPEELLTGDTEEAARESFKSLFKTVAPMLFVKDEAIDSYPFENFPLKWDGKKLRVDFNMELIMDTVKNKSLQPSEPKGRFEGETLFVIGKKSQFKVHKDKSIEEHFTRASRYVFEEAGHFIHSTYPQQFVQVVSEFINRGVVEQRSKY